VYACLWAGSSDGEGATRWDGLRFSVRHRYIPIGLYCLSLPFIHTTVAPNGAISTFVDML
jgi:hypothetical protein